MKSWHFTGNKIAKGLAWEEWIFVQCSRYFEELHKEDGIWFCRQEEETGSRFSDETQDRLFCLEDDSWWFRYRRKVVYLFVKKYFDAKKDSFDIGGGNGYTTLYIQKKGFQTALLEPSYGACRNAKKRGVQTVICGALEEGNMQSHTAGQFLLLDVLEHMENDAEFLKRMSRKLCPGAYALITVPAFPVLWSSEDTAAGHYRRYTRKRMIKLLTDAGFEICYAGYFFSFLFFPVLLVRVGMEKAGLLKRCEERTAEEAKNISQKQFQTESRILQKVLYVLERLEMHRLVQGKHMPFGSSILCVVKNRMDEEGCIWMNRT